MKTIPAAVLLAAAALSLTACNLENDPAAASVPQSAVPTTVRDLPAQSLNSGVSGALVDEAFMSALKADGIPTHNRTATIALGHSVCSSGVRTVESAGISPQYAAEVVAQAVESYCPQRAN